jgi:hypothetical protein
MSLPVRGQEEFISGWAARVQLKKKPNWKTAGLQEIWLSVIEKQKTTFLFNYFFAKLYLLDTCSDFTSQKIIYFFRFLLKLLGLKSFMQDT